ncbi:acyl-CoA carboxylase subunit epsilon [Zhihengliuella halotolerans]|uniref:acyl-CoA carboxylase subunit epsilon n=1 Tax=Zhihengliuella halotolerans TaxID=370736 RepID=UPI000C80A9CF|nr:acyl-CoA carboxylase subunit epsilon [Zhihengliuella halotolerans]
MSIDNRLEGTTPAPAGAAAGAPALEVTRGNPTPEELAALTAVVLSLRGTEAVEHPGRRTRKDTIRDRVRHNRRMVSMPGAWRSGRT